MSKGTLMNTLGTRVAPMNVSGALLLKLCMCVCCVSYGACPSELYLTLLWLIAQPGLFCHFLCSEQANRGKCTGVWYHTVLSHSPFSPPSPVLITRQKIFHTRTRVQSPRAL